MVSRTSKPIITPGSDKEQDNTNTVDFTQELGQLLSYIGHVNKAVRFHTYGMRDIINPVKKRPVKHCGDVGLFIDSNQMSTLEDRLWNIVWISDSLHNLHELGDALYTGNLDNIIVASGALISMYKAYTNCPSTTNDASVIACNKPNRCVSIRTFNIEFLQDTNGLVSEHLTSQHSQFSIQDALNIFTAINTKALNAKPFSLIK